MTPHRSRTRRPLVAGLLGAGLVLAGCAFVTAATGPAIVLPDGKTRTLQPGELLVPPSTVDAWRRLADSGKGRLLARCSNDTGLCTTVVVPLGGADPGTRPGDPSRTCPAGEKPVQDQDGRYRCLWELNLSFDRK